MTGTLVGRVIGSDGVACGGAAGEQERAYQQDCKRKIGDIDPREGP